MVTSAITQRTEVSLESPGVSVCGVCLSPLQLSSGVLMTPLMAAWAAAFCFFRSSIVFLNSFSSESLNKEKKPYDGTREKNSKEAAFPSKYWQLIVNLWNTYVQGGENEVWDTRGSTPSTGCKTAWVLWYKKMHIFCNAGIMSIQVYCPKTQCCQSCKCSSWCSSPCPCMDALGWNILQKYAILKTCVQSNNL